jgi:hypothetical protein
MKKSINVYWACLEDEWIRAVPPSSVYKNIIKRDSAKQSGLNKCPAFKDYTENIFGLHSIYDYNFNVNQESGVSSTLYDQKFFDTHVNIRSVEDKFFSFKQRFVFFTEEDSLMISAGIMPFFEENDITKKCISIPGSFDIGKWFRSLEFAFYLKKEYDDFSIKENEIFQYIKFETDSSIVFKQFSIDASLYIQSQAIENSRSNRNGKFRELSNYYSMLKNKKHIIKSIKNNIID